VITHAETGERGSEVFRERRTAEGAGGGTDDRDSDLHGREEPFGLVPQRLDGQRAPLASVDALLELGGAHAEDGDLRSGEQAVCEHQRHDDHDLEGHDATILPSAPVSPARQGGIRFTSAFAPSWRSSESWFAEGLIEVNHLGRIGEHENLVPRYPVELTDRDVTRHRGSYRDARP
jgi:hypothetical protein